MTSAWYFINALDVLMLRGNKLFGDAGSYGEAAMPPSPSVVAGAVRSALLARRGVDLGRFAKGEIEDHPDLGTPARPGSFAVTAFGIARSCVNGGSEAGHSVEPLFPLPADLVASKSEGVVNKSEGVVKVSRMRPGPPGIHAGIGSSALLPRVAILAEQKRNKPESGNRLTATGWKAYLEGEEIDSGELVAEADLWKVEARVGIGLDAARRHAADGQLFTTQAVAFHRDVGFFVGTTGVANVPDDDLLLRFGGDGRAALAKKAAVNLPQPDYRRIAEQNRCRIVLTSPGIFAKGWLPTGMTDDGHFALGGVTGKLCCAAVPRHGVISGFDLAARKPKPALRVAPAGSTYWIDDLGATPEALGKLAARGLWSEDAENNQRRAEGFNLFTFAAY